MKKILALLLCIAMIMGVFVSCDIIGGGEPSGSESEQKTESTSEKATEDKTEESTEEKTEPTETDSSTETPSETESETGSIEAKTQYNIIFALATIPPVMAALEAIDSGFETYAIIERGKTYNGIAEISYFHNVGFDPANNLSNGFTSTEFNAMVEQVKALSEADENAFFNFYVQDGTALRGVAIAANAGLTAEQFHIYMCEDGTGAYNALNKSYVHGKKVNAEKDEVYDTFAAKVTEMKTAFETVMSKTDNKNGDAALKYNIGNAFALAALDNFTYILQNESTVLSILENTGATKTKLLSSFGFDGYDAETEFTVSLKFKRLAEGVSALSSDERTDYLKLMYGQYYADTYTALTRTERADESAPSAKLVFIGSRHGGYPKLASDVAFGIGGLAADDALPASYAELDAKYKMPLLFPTEADYNTFLAVINNPDNYNSEWTDEIKERIKVACFNIYIDYIYTLKFTYATYGEEYDLIMKGHPREVIGAYTEWGNRYKVDDKCYDKLLDNALLAFHAGDSTGKYIGMVPYGTAAENLAYLGADIALTGLPSSTYSGFDTSVGILSIIAVTDEDIVGTGKETAASQVKERYEDGTLLYTDKSGEVKTSTFYNTGNILKSAAELCRKAENASAAEMYDALFSAWLARVHAGAEGIDAQGFAIKAQ